MTTLLNSLVLAHFISCNGIKGDYTIFYSVYWTFYQIVALAALKRTQRFFHDHLEANMGIRYALYYSVIVLAVWAIIEVYNRKSYIKRQVAFQKKQEEVESIPSDIQKLFKSAGIKKSNLMDQEFEDMLKKLIKELLDSELKVPSDVPLPPPVEPSQLEGLPSLESLAPKESKEITEEPSPKPKPKEIESPPMPPTEKTEPELQQEEITQVPTEVPTEEKVEEPKKEVPAPPSPQIIKKELDEEAKSGQTSVKADGIVDLLQSIRARPQLRKVETTEVKKGKKEPADPLVNLLQKAMSERRSVIDDLEMEVENENEDWM
jgi:hypothetical protein